MKIVLWILMLTATTHTQANTHSVVLGFGELPIVADSFKPSIGYFRNFNQYEVGISLQMKDHLRRDDESFNADFGQDGIVSSRESTGYRSMLQTKLFILESPFYVSLAMIYGGEDTEEIVFDTRVRTIGLSQYDTSLQVRLERKKSIEPAIGLGFSLPVSGNWYFTSDFTMALFGSIPEPSITIGSSDTLSTEDLSALKLQIRENYRTNFHNRYHVFTLGMTYKF